MEKQSLKTTITLEFSASEIQLVTDVLTLIATARGEDVSFECGNKQFQPIETEEPETDSGDEKTAARSTDGDNETAPGRSTDVTRDDIRELMSEVIEADDSTRPKILKEFGRIGAKNIGTIKDEDVVDFFEFLQSLKDE